MAWKLLPTDYTDAVWSGLKRYTQVDNSDGTVSFNDVTTYTNKEKSFFGAKDANRMNEALNYIMSMLENGTNLYEEFQTYFTTQKELFKSSGDSSYQELTQYFVNLKAQGDSSLAQIEKTYEEHMTTYEGEQTAHLTHGLLVSKVAERRYCRKSAKSDYRSRRAFSGTGIHDLEEPFHCTCCD